MCTLPRPVLGMGDGAPSTQHPAFWAPRPLAWINSSQPIVQGSRSRPLLAFWFHQESGRPGVARA